MTGNPFVFNTLPPLSQKTYCDDKTKTIPLLLLAGMAEKKNSKVVKRRHYGQWYNLVKQKGGA